MVKSRLTFLIGWGVSDWRLYTVNFIGKSQCNLIFHISKGDVSYSKICKHEKIVTAEFREGGCYRTILWMV